MSTGDINNHIKKIQENIPKIEKITSANIRIIVSHNNTPWYFSPLRNLIGEQFVDHLGEQLVERKAIAEFVEMKISSLDKKAAGIVVIASPKDNFVVVKADDFLFNPGKNFDGNILYFVKTLICSIREKDALKGVNECLNKLSDFLKHISPSNNALANETERVFLSEDEIIICVNCINSRNMPRKLGNIKEKVLGFNFKITD
jgi:hypothetical protein